MTYLQAAYAAIGLITGGIIAWLISLNRSKTKLAGAERRASSAEGAVSELHAQNQKADEDFRALRSEHDKVLEAKVKAETQLTEALQRLDEERKLLEDARTKLTDTFKALSDDALKSNNKAFLELAKSSLDKVMAEARGDLGKRQEAISGLIKPLGDSLKKYEEHIKGLEESRIKAYTSLDEHLKNLSTAQQQLQKETGNLVNALRKPQVRGRWGELTLIRVAELAGMTEHCDFTEQVSVETDSGRIRPDVIVHLPAGREIVIDAKVSLDAYLDAQSADTEEQRTNCLVRHKQQIRTHMNDLGAKAYWEQFDKAPEFVVMFIPGEPFLSAAVDHDPGLIEDGMKKQIILATPTTLIALLRAIAYGWRQEQVTKNAQEICSLGKQLYERMKVLSDHLIDMGKGLERANSSYNKAVGSMEARVFPAARRFKELGATPNADISVINPVESAPRTLNLPEPPEDS
jgi:DNA recombination protein RmuC